MYIAWLCKYSLTDSCQYTGSSLTKCAFNGQQCCSSQTIALFGTGINIAIGDYTPTLIRGFDTTQDAFNELKNATKGTDCLPAWSVH